MKTFTIIAGLCVSTAFAQQLSTVSQFSNQIEQNSALLQLQDRMLTVNDHGGNASIYEFDASSGAVTREVTLANAINMDWEALSADDEFIYVCDIGNDLLSQHSFAIYRVDLQSYAMFDEVEANPSRFNYPNNLALDANAAVVIEDNIYVFAKGDPTEPTYIYRIPTTPGNYTATLVDSLSIEGMVTDATINNADQLLLSVIDDAGALSVAEVDFGTGIGMEFELENQFQLTVPAPHSDQIEGFCALNNGSYYFSSEVSSSGSSALFELSAMLIASTTEHEIASMEMYPNPASTRVTIKCSAISTLNVYALSGERIWQDTLEKSNFKINTENWESGVYIIQTTSASGTTSSKLSVR